MKTLFAPYIEVLRPQHHASIALGGFLARVPAAILGFATFLLFQRTTDSFALGGLVSGVVIATGAVMGPVLGRLADRHGQRRLLRIFAVTHLLSVLLLVIAGHAHVPALLFVVLAGIAGATVAPIGSFTRARWSHRYGDAPQLKTAFALEAILDEMVWIIGPAVAALIAAAVDPAVGLVLSGACGFAGSLILAAQRATDTPPHEPDTEVRRPGFTPLGSARLMAVLIAGFVVGVSFGVDNVSAVAISQRDGVPELAGVILSVYSVGSILGGFVLGALPDRLSPFRLFVATALFLAVAFAPLAFAPDTIWIMVFGFFAGAAVTPYTVGANRAVEALVPRRVVTEALSWANTAILAGMALGGPLGGLVVDAAGPRAGYLAVSGLCLLPVLVALTAAFGSRRARPEDA
ncbi:MFS transporter [Herbiconiux ginsengi]|uniref:Predicted arabinose efflux permease, MFS family n=1 Tax=Herbiconiux ginsengi TaxID=381665 RepID=A0A1H3KMC0_9MICO|nr:MFS transporter [Herbiconiux ginsengi]SDY53186.1 Predicted arabinose efflux permease, MFS family [Herbiconiux ginsengi]